MLRMRSGRPASAAALVGLLILAGCGGGGEKLIPVEGKVTVDGQPLTTGTVIFHPDTAKGNATMHEPRGELDQTGTYKIAVGTTTTGAPPGWYKVYVYAAVKTNPQDPYSPEKWLVDPKYGDAATSGLAVEVKDGAPSGHYDLKLGK